MELIISRKEHLRGGALLLLLFPPLISFPKEINARSRVRWEVEMGRDAKEPLEELISKCGNANE